MGTAGYEGQQTPLMGSAGAQPMTSTRTGMPVQTYGDEYPSAG
jgi:hypothetical protein